MTPKAVIADDSSATAALARSLGFDVAEAAMEPSVLVAAAIDGERLAGCLRPPHVGAMQSGADWNGGGRYFLHHLQQGGIGLALHTLTAYDGDAAHLFSSALQARLHEEGLRCAADLDFVVHEALANAMIHGNLEVAGTPSGSVENMLRFGDMVEHALADPVRAGRMVWLSATHTDDRLDIVVEDQGRGFCLPPPADPPLDAARPHGLELIARAGADLRLERGGRCVTLNLALERRGLSRRAFAPASVLVVDDNPVNRRMLVALVQSLGVGRVDGAADGIEGLAAIAAHRPDLVLLDVMMPHMDGLEMCRRLRGDHALSDLPVLFITALDDSKSRAACFAAGGNDVVSKPIDTREVSARVGVHLHNALLMARMTSYQDRVREELAEARQAQATLLPSPRDLEAAARRTGLAIRGEMVSSTELGGDFWTLYDAGPHQLGILVADFTGHGLTAALNVFRLHVLLSRLPRQVPGPAAMLGLLNRDLKSLLKVGQFAAAFVGVVNVASGTLTYAGAAAPPAVLTIDGTARLLDASGPPLGAFAAADYHDITVGFPPGATLLVYSDALVESETMGRPVCDEATLLRWAAETGAQAVDSVLERFRQRIPGPPPDDLTLVSLHRPAG